MQDRILPPKKNIFFYFAILRKCREENNREKERARERERERERQTDKQVKKNE